MNLSLRSQDAVSGLVFEALLEAFVSRLRPVEAVVQFSNIDPYPVFAEGYRPIDRVREEGLEDDGPVLYPGDPGYFDGVEELRYVFLGAFIQAQIDPTEFAARTGRTCKWWHEGFLLDGDWSTRWQYPKQWGGVA
jgi:hypothetical protein